MGSAQFWHTPEEAQQVLTEFINLSSADPVLESYAELEELINVDVRLAMSDLIMQTGSEPRSHQQNSLKVLQKKHSFVKFQAVTHNENGSSEPSAIQLEERNWPYRFGINKNRYAFLKIFDDDPFISARDGVHIYLPCLTTEEYLEFNRDVIGDFRRVDITGELHTGVETANRESGMASGHLTGYLNTVFSLTRGLVEV
ncbi:MAG TPA: hypothetical protein VIH90_08470 [Candidatus Saccharimonadales bacterium]